MASVIVREGFQVDEAAVKSVQRPPKLEVKPSALNDVYQAPHVNGKHLGSEGINGLLKICNVKSTCQVSAITHGTGHPTPAVASIAVAGSINLDPRTRRLVRTVAQGFRAEQEPEAAQDGLGGTYFLMNESGKPAALIKPCDEEPLAPNNPKGFVGRQLGDPGMKSSVRVGEAAIREVAAYLLDHDHRAKVPATVLVRASHPVFHVAHPLVEDPATPISASISSNAYNTPGTEDGTPGSNAESTAPRGKTQLVPSKLGSLQEYTSHICDSSEVGAGRFNAKNIHLIGILDLRLLNTDRHAGNLLVRKPEYGSQARLGAGAMIMESNQLELIPIDHGFCLPDSLEAPYFEWLHWPQAMLPFDEDELDFIADLDPEADADMLRTQLPMLRSDCLRTLWLSTVTLQRCAAAGLTLSEIGTVYSRPLVGLDEEPSELERLVRTAWQHVLDVRNGGTCYEDLEEGEEEDEGCFPEEDEEEGLEEEDEEEEGGEEECCNEAAEEGERMFGVSDSASSHLSSSQQCKGVGAESSKGGAAVSPSASLAGRPDEVEVAGAGFFEVHDSPRSSSGLAVTVPSPPGSMGDLQFQLQLEESDGGGPTPKGANGGLGFDPVVGFAVTDPSVVGEADSWSLAPFSKASLSLAGSVLGNGPQQPDIRGSLSSSDDELLEQAFSLRPASALSTWRRHQNPPDVGKAKALHALTPSHARRTRQRARAAAGPLGGGSWQTLKEAEPGRLGDLEDAEWEVFREGFCGHLDAALQAGMWSAANQAGAAAARNVFGSSAPC